MAYLTCPWCLTPQMVADDVNEYHCFTCAAEVGFIRCTSCTFVQAVSKRWRAFTCTRCRTKIDLPYRWGYDPNAKAYLVKGTGRSWPEL
jgi:hypothetical protein